MLTLGGLDYATSPMNSGRMQRSKLFEIQNNQMTNPVSVGSPFSAQVIDRQSNKVEVSCME